MPRLIWVFAGRTCHFVGFVIRRLSWSSLLGKRPATRQLSRSMTKPTKWPARPAKTQISLGICPVWLESSLSAWRSIGPLATHWAQAKTLIRLDGCPSWSESSLGAPVILLVLSCGGSFKYGYEYGHMGANANAGAFLKKCRFKG